MENVCKHVQNWILNKTINANNYVKKFLINMNNN